MRTLVRTAAAAEVVWICCYCSAPLRAEPPKCTPPARALSRKDQQIRHWTVPSHSGLEATAVK